MQRFARAALAGLLLGLLIGCAGVPIATKSGDRLALAGIWEEDWPGETEKDRFEIKVQDETITITPLTHADKMAVRRVEFQQRRLTFYLDLNGSSVYYDLVLVDRQLLSGRVTGGEKLYDETVRWYRKK